MPVFLRPLEMTSTSYPVYFLKRVVLTVIPMARALVLYMVTPPPHRDHSMHANEAHHHGGHRAATSLFLFVLNQLGSASTGN